MENNERHDQWVDRRLASLEPPHSWQPNVSAGLARFRERQKAHRIKQTRWTWAAVAASLTGIGMFLLVPAPCSGAGCSKVDNMPSAPTAVSGPAVALPPAPPVT